MSPEWNCTCQGGFEQAKTEVREDYVEEVATKGKNFSKQVRWVLQQTSIQISKSFQNDYIVNSERGNPEMHRRIRS